MTYNPELKKFTVAIDTPKNGERVEQFDIMINACGQTVDYRNNAKLYQNMDESETVDFTFIGSLDVDTNNLRVKSNKTDRIYACGPPTIGNFLIVNFLKNIHNQAKAITKDIVERALEINERPKL